VLTFNFEQPCFFTPVKALETRLRRQCNAFDNAPSIAEDNNSAENAAENIITS